MADQDALTPRVIHIRHGETEWAKSGKYTGTTEIELTPMGIQQVTSAAKMFVGAGRFLDPSRVKHVFVSPRKRAKQTFELLLPALPSDAAEAGWKVTYTEDVAEWDYGDYEGLKAGEIRRLRKQRGLDQEREWDIWRDGCEGGETTQQVTERLSRLIMKIVDIQRPYMNGEKPADVVIVAHGLILRCFVKLWLGLSVDFPISMTMAPGAMGVLSYKNNDADTRTHHIGIAPPFVEED